MMAWLLVLALFPASSASSRDDSSDETVVRITASESEYSPREIVVRRGAQVVLELLAVDRDHGFNLPAFDVRAYLMVGRVTRVRLTPSRAGRFPFHCDVYCGPEHDFMTGVLDVRE
jgi:cytochrome c oxidase subunit 2